MRHLLTYDAGLDIGSTTAKIVLMDENHDLVFSNYCRHHARILDTVRQFLENITDQLGNCQLNLTLTGSVSLGLANTLQLPFVQEVVCTHEFIRQKFPDISCVIDVGGEDSKMIFMDQNKTPDIRMNGNCAGGTGAFIDQIATLLDMEPSRLNQLSKDHQTIYPVASRCGVFAKTDVQNMLSRNIPKQDIAASIFHAVAVQCINTLARGKKIIPQILFCGGVFAYLPELVSSFLNVLNLSADDRVIPERPELLPAMGAALSSKRSTKSVSAVDFLNLLNKLQQHRLQTENRLPPLFLNKNHFFDWEKDQSQTRIQSCPLDSYNDHICFVGIDSGSTTTKIVVLGKNKELLFNWYRNNQGNPIQAVIKGLSTFKKKQANENPKLKIVKTAVTGYGEDLIRTAFGIDEGVVETIAHFKAARFIEPDASFVLDIGGQDMKAVFVENNAISRVEINEACSSGCGSFLETFSKSLETDIEDFARQACHSGAPCDLGTRCTVFMNSKVKQALREQATIGDISAGLAYSVIKNCLFKVLKLTASSQIGDHIVVQGGAFKNPSIIRALELISNKKVRSSNIPELMGAFGAGLVAIDAFLNSKGSSFIGLSELENIEQYQTRQLHCKGCENTCNITQFLFTNQQTMFSGNKCEKHFSSKGNDHLPGINLFDFKNDLLFNREDYQGDDVVATLGIPRCLHIYENYPFWHTLFTRCRIRIRLSSPSTIKLSEKGMGTVMSDNICFPAKLAHGHLFDLLEQQVDRIFYPIVVYEKKDHDQAVNTFNCPIVTAYADVLNNTLEPDLVFKTPLDRPAVNFNDHSLLEKTCITYLKQFKIPVKIIRQALKEALSSQAAFKNTLKNKAKEIVDLGIRDNRLTVLLAGRPYQIDPLINHKVPDILTGLGAHVITEDIILDDTSCNLENTRVITQWAYPNRIYMAAQWVAQQPGAIQLVQLNSFGCGPDAVVIDEIKDILATGSKNHTLIKVDEIFSQGSVRLRLRSMVESLDRRSFLNTPRPQKRPFPVPFLEKDRKRTILAPYFGEDYATFLPAIFKNAGYTVKILPKPDQTSVNLGLQYASHDICYPGTLLIGDIIKALQTNKYHPEEIAVGITQTGGQCRASSYLPLIQKAMFQAGFEDIPVISVSENPGMNVQPGFHINWLKKLKLLYVSTMFSDCLAKMYYATVVREINKGSSQKLRQYYMSAMNQPIIEKDYRSIFNLLKKAIHDFNQIPIKNTNPKKMGIVGEIYVKYNYFGNQYLADWLIERNVEPVFSPIVDFFTQNLVNYKCDIAAGIRARKTNDILGHPIDWLIQYYHAKINRIFSDFRYYSPFHNIHSVAKDASKILSMTTQFGEGWLIAGEIAAFAKEGIRHIISVQPFGCIANHIVSKGIEPKIRSLFPDVNLYFMDFDTGASEANIHNRLHFMVEHL